jgi:ankyrin repeat protein
LAAGADPNYEYSISYDHKSIKRTVLILAASMGHPGIVQLLLDKGANVNAKGLIAGSEHGLEVGTALEAAESAKHAEVAALLKKVRQD